MGKPRGCTGKGCAYTYWANAGAHFGFPPCCIEAFLDADYKFDDTRFIGTGYKPCNTCNTRPYEELVKHINTNRKHPTPFPDCSGFVKDFKDSCYG